MASGFCGFMRIGFQPTRELRAAIVLVVCWLVFPARVMAQRCQDSAWGLVFSQTFGDASHPISLTGQTSYEYEPISCPGDGQYTLASTLDTSCFNATWYAIPSDHTPNDQNGNMLLVNGGPLPGVFYQQPVHGLCAGTSYEISVWIINLLKTETCSNPLIPDLAISVETSDGVLIQTASLGQITQTTSPIWRQYTTLFTLPADTEDVVIKFINNQGGGGCGNDMAIDDVQINQCSACSSPDDQLYVPDAFTPNQDGLNDSLAVFLRSYVASTYTLRIFNRWGNLLFVSTNPATQWDGTFGGIPCPQDTYTWQISYRTPTVPQKSFIKTGRVLLIR